MSSPKDPDHEGGIDHTDHTDHADHADHLPDVCHCFFQYFAEGNGGDARSTPYRLLDTPRTNMQHAATGLKSGLQLGLGLGRGVRSGLDPQLGLKLELGLATDGGRGEIATTASTPGETALFKMSHLRQINHYLDHLVPH